MGLSTVYGIVTQNAGRITRESQPGGGTTVSIYLPRVADPSMEAPTRSADRAGDGTETILLVEDEAQLRRLAERVLTRRGYRVRAAGSPQDALAILRLHGAIDLLLTDVILPGMNGKELALEVQRTQAGVKCLFMSGYTADAIVQWGVFEDGLCFLEKPFSPDKLAAAVREALDGKAPRG